MPLSFDKNNSKPFSKQTMNLAPIILFVYNRPWHTRQTVEALLKNDLADQSELVIFSDAPKNETMAVQVGETRNYIKTISGFKKITIIERGKNLGLADSIICGVTEIINKFGTVVVLEDDMVTSPNFLKYANGSLNFYREDKRISAISGYTYPITLPEDYPHEVFVTLRGSPWGWATWKDRWDNIDWELKDLPLFLKDRKKLKLFSQLGDDLRDRLIAKLEGRIDAWSIVRTFCQFKRHEYTLYPKDSKVFNIGCDASGVNYCGSTSNWDVDLDNSGTETKFIDNIQPDQKINERIRRLFAYSFKTRLIRFVKRRLNI
jgi:hypothetical protein